MKRIILFACILFTVLRAHAQSQPDTAVDKRLIKHNQIVLCSGGFICNDRISPFVELKNKLVLNPEAFNEYQKSQSNSFLKALPGYIVLGGLVGGIATLNSNNNLSGKIILGSLIPLFIFSPFNHRNMHLKKALEIYNKKF